MSDHPDTLSALIADFAYWGCGVDEITETTRAGGSPDLTTILRKHPAPGGAVPGEEAVGAYHATVRPSKADRPSPALAEVAA